MGTGMIGMQWIIFIGIAVVSWLVPVSYTHLTLPTT